MADNYVKYSLILLLLYLVYDHIAIINCSVATLCPALWIFHVKTILFMI